MRVRLLSNGDEFSIHYSLPATRYPLPSYRFHYSLLATCCALLFFSPMILFHCELGGEGNPPIILLHGMLGSSRNWLTTGADLAPQYHVFALDLRNHGKSPHADSMSYEDMVGDLLAWMDSQQLN